MKKLIPTTLFLFAAWHLIQTAEDPVAQQLFIAAEQQANVFHHDASPFELNIDFSVQMNVPARGHLTLKWESDNRWWRKIVMGEFQQTDIRNGDKLYISRNLGFTPVRIRELPSLLQFAQHSEELQVNKAKHRVEHGVEMTCLHLERKNARDGAHELCLSSGSREILSDEWKVAPDGKRRQQYSDYFEFRGHHYPRKLELFVNGIKAITANVNSLATASLDQALLVPPKGAIERRQCSDMKHAVPVKTPDPIIPSLPARTG